MSTQPSFWTQSLFLQPNVLWLKVTAVQEALQHHTALHCCKVGTACLELEELHNDCDYLACLGACCLPARQLQRCLHSHEGADASCHVVDNTYNLWCIALCCAAVAHAAAIADNGLAAYCCSCRVVLQQFAIVVKACCSDWGRLRMHPVQMCCVHCIAGVSTPWLRTDSTGAALETHAADCEGDNG